MTVLPSCYFLLPSQQHCRLVGIASDDTRSTFHESGVGLELLLHHACIFIDVRSVLFPMQSVFPTVETALYMIMVSYQLRIDNHSIDCTQLVFGSTAHLRTSTEPFRLPETRSNGNQLVEHIV